MTQWEKVPDFELTDIRYEKRPGVARITINRPDALNAFTTHTTKELAEALEDACYDDRIGVVVLTGAGNRAFCVGGDAKEAESGYSSELGRHLHLLCVDMAPEAAS